MHSSKSISPNIRIYFFDAMRAILILFIQFDWLSSTFSTYISNGKVIFHLWFLIDLTIFFLITYLGIKVIPKFLTTLSYLFNKLFLKSNIYILLVLIAIVMGLIFIEIDINIYLKFMIIFVLTLSSSIFLHHFLISKINLLSFLYNGTPLKRKKKNNA